MTTAIGYIRVSTEDQAREGISLDAQREKIRAYCKLKDMELVEIIEDAAASAKNLKRPGAQRLLELANERKMDAVIVCKLDRMFRSTIDALETTRRFDKLGIGFHSITETIDTKSALGKFFFTIIAASAELERHQICERTRAVLQHKKAMNEKTGGLTPYGYDNAAGKLILNAKEQQVIRKILRLRKHGNSYSGISSILNARKVKTKTGRRWYAQTVKNVVSASKRD